MGKDPSGYAVQVISFILFSKKDKWQNHIYNNAPHCLLARNRLVIFIKIVYLVVCNESSLNLFTIIFAIPHFNFLQIASMQKKKQPSTRRNFLKQITGTSLALGVGSL